MAIIKQLKPEEYSEDRIRALKEVGRMPEIGQPEVEQMVKEKEAVVETQTEGAEGEAKKDKRTMKVQAEEIIAGILAEMDEKGIDKKVQKKVCAFGVWKLRCEEKKKK